MHLKTVLLAAGLTATVATAQPQPQPQVGTGAVAPSARFCGLPGQKCHKLKRAAEAATDALAQVNAGSGSPASLYCNQPGKPCHKAKRSAEALAHAAAEAYAVADPEPDPEAWRIFCGMIGESCFKVKRAVELIDATLNEPEPHAGASEGLRGDCHAEGNDCATAQQAASALSRAARRALAGL